MQLYGNEDGEGVPDDVDANARMDDYDSEEVRELPEPQEEAQPPRAVRDPGAPTPGERAEHELTHANYRSWCAACVRGRGIAAAHRQQPSEPMDPSGVPTIHFDYCFMGEKADEAEEEKDREDAWEKNDDVISSWSSLAYTSATDPTLCQRKG